MMHLNNGGFAYDGFFRYSGVSLYRFPHLKPLILWEVVYLEIRFYTGTPLFDTSKYVMKHCICRIATVQMLCHGLNFSGPYRGYRFLRVSHANLKLLLWFIYFELWTTESWEMGKGDRIEVGGYSKQIMSWAFLIDRQKLKITQSIFFQLYL